MIVYVITNLVTGKKYVGKSTRTLPDRWKEHKSEARQCRKNWSLYEDMRELGFDKFSIEVLGECEYQDRLNRMERRFIREIGTLAPKGYNLQVGGGGGLKKFRGGTLGMNRTAEVKDKIRATMLAHWTRKKGIVADVSFP